MQLKYQNKWVSPFFIIHKKENVCGHVYILQSQHSVKIGKSSCKNVFNRIKTLTRNQGLVGKYWISQPFTNYSFLEKLIHTELESKNSIAEHFNINFNDAVSIVEKICQEQGRIDYVKDVIKINGCPKDISLVFCQMLGVNP